MQQSPDMIDGVVTRVGVVSPLGSCCLGQLAIGIYNPWMLEEVVLFQRLVQLGLSWQRSKQNYDWA